MASPGIMPAIPHLAHPSYHYCPCGDDSIRTAGHILYHCQASVKPGSYLDWHAQVVTPSPTTTSAARSTLDFLRGSRCLTKPEQGPLPHPHHLDQRGQPGRLGLTSCEESLPA